MALTVKQLNADASFLLTFEPIVPESIPGVAPRPFRILLDPWITGPSTIFHSKLSITTHKETPCVCSLQQLPEPDLVIISQHKSDHCNEVTLKQLPASGTRTLILAEPSAAKVIRSWKHFEKDKVHTIPRWEDHQVTGRQSVIRVKVPPFIPGGEFGEVSVAFIPQRRDLKGLHAAIGITYRPPPTWPRFTHLLTPPDTPVSQHHNSQLSLSQSPTAARTKAEPTYISLPTPPETPSTQSLRSVRSATSIPPTTDPRDRAISVLFSPHGISYHCLRQYTSSHLATEAALPLTALLHCFDTVSNPWWLGGNISAGMPTGQETAMALGAKAWISTHDGDKDVRGLATRMLRTRKYAQKEVADVVSPVSKSSSRVNREKAGSEGSGKSTDVLVLGVGEEVAMTREGVWNVEPKARIIPPRSFAHIEKTLSGRARGRNLSPIITRM
ncbi:uncharacterized protein CTRU02_208719 [Colletotrichum truncatum]|uniref:Uncharacterized protein n=1 Tax=Colletotrichum truncatum TaxID=5467 RepID=A0ACC3YX85_COLTU|nr:uncharacterized protein CTRU02_06624 [Colletotrichum truncatum]KAF6792541.1 hypothetical protein CTRU02_06624 [Colletotrichum truncatum]